MRAEVEAEAEKRDETRNIYINNKHNKCENCTKIATTLSGGCPRSQLRRRLERACALSALCSLSPALPSLFAANWDAACDESWRMNQKCWTRLTATSRRSVAVAVDADVTLLLHSAALPTAQSVQLFQLATRNSPIRELPLILQAGRQAALRGPAAKLAQRDTRYGHLSGQIGAYGNSCSQQVIDLLRYRLSESALWHLQHCKFCSISALSIYRFIDLSIYRFINLSTCLLVANTSAQRLLRRRWVTAACVGVAATRRVRKKNYRNRNWNWKCNNKNNNSTHGTNIRSIRSDL